MSTPPLISRPTKYRAWTGRDMVTVQTLCFNNGGMIWYGAGSDMGWSCVWDSPQWTVDNPKPTEGDLKPVMQWTGLVDKTGREIYEGDIIEREGNNLADQFTYGLTPTSKHCARDGQRYVIVSLLSGFTLVPDYSYDMSIAPNQFGNIGQYNFWNGASTATKVIGNVFENPDLLKS